MPSANGHAPRDVGMCGCLVGWLVACLAAWLVDWFVGGVVGTKPRPKSPLGELLGGSWAPDGAKRLQDRKCTKNPNFSTLLFGGKLELKSTKNPSWGDPKGDHFLYRFLDRLLKRFGANLAPTWLPKPSQNGAKLVPKSMQVGVLI